VIRVWGAGALAAASEVFRPHRRPSLADSPAGRLRVGRVGAGAGDEVVAVHDGDPPFVEIHTHGGPQPVALVMRALTEAGAVEARPEDWLAESASPISAEAWADLARAPTSRAAEILLEQALGALEIELARLAGLCERDDGRDEALAGVEALLGRGQIGTRLLDGWRIVLAGRPNVGKSRLMNALAGYERTIVDPTPGTTRDVVTLRTAIDGWPVEVSDTAGLREASDPIEAEGVAHSRARQAGADVVVLVLDLSEPLTEADAALVAGLPSALVVANKADLPAAWEPTGRNMLVISAERGDGMETLMAALAQRLVPEPPGPGASIPFRPSQLRLLERARLRLQQGHGARAARLLRRIVRA
jgi:tRNA modification GTPase